MFAIPLNTWHQHFNGSGKDAARYRRGDQRCRRSSTSSTTSSSSSTRTYDFKERFNGEPDYFANKGEQDGLLLDTNFVADAVNLPLIAREGARRRRRRTSASTWRRGT